jgi:hypothetical protein
LTPIPARASAVDNQGMVQFAIRCHRYVPVDVDELEHWFEQQILDLRTDAPDGTVRLSRLTQHLPSRELDIGWLLEVEVPETQSALARDRLLVAVRDMRLLGLQPTLLTPFGVAEWRGQPGEADHVASGGSFGNAA